MSVLGPTTLTFTVWPPGPFRPVGTQGTLVRRITQVGIRYAFTLCFWGGKPSIAPRAHQFCPSTLPFTTRVAGDRALQVLIGVISLAGPPQHRRHAPPTTPAFRPSREKQRTLSPLFLRPRRCGHRRWRPLSRLCLCRFRLIHPLAAPLSCVEHVRKVQSLIHTRQIQRPLSTTIAIAAAGPW